MDIESSRLFQRVARGLDGLPELSWVLPQFKLLRERISAEASYIKTLFPEYTPHDEAFHFSHLFQLADKLLGDYCYDQLNPIELALLAFALYSHDWGMAVSGDERDCIWTGKDGDKFALVDGEPRSWQDFAASQVSLGRTKEEVWRNYVRITHGHRSAARLRHYLAQSGNVFGDAVARLAEGHMLDARDIRDTQRYPLAHSVAGYVTNLAALATYVRIVDLLDIGDDRTPYSLWKFINPRNLVSKTEWEKHRALAPVAVDSTATPHRLIVNGVTDNVDVYAALEDLRTWVQSQVADSLKFLGSLAPRYRLNLAHDVDWHVSPEGFEPILTRFEPDRAAIINLLIQELYGQSPHSFIRELLQNSVDAIDTRAAILTSQDQPFSGQISVSIDSAPDALQIEWKDNGVGMDLQVLNDYFASIGKSWYSSESFRRAGSPHHPISRFGIGVLSCFAVAEAIELHTRRQGVDGHSYEGLAVQIPRPDAFFRISTPSTLPVGTRLLMKVIEPESRGVTPQSILEYLRDVAGFLSTNCRCL